MKIAFDGKVKIVDFSSISESRLRRFACKHSFEIMSQEIFNEGIIPIHSNFFLF